MIDRWFSRFLNLFFFFKSVCGVAKAASDTAEDEAKQNYCFQCSCVFVVPRVCVCVSFPSSCMFSVSFLCLCHFHMIFIDYSIKDNTAVIYSYCIYFDIQTDVAWLDAVCILFIQSDIVLHLSRNRNVFIQTLLLMQGLISGDTRKLYMCSFDRVWRAKGACMSVCQCTEAVYVYMLFL